MARFTMLRLLRRGSSALDVEVKQANDSTMDATNTFNIVIPPRLRDFLPVSLLNDTFGGFFALLVYLYTYCIVKPKQIIYVL